MKLIIKEILGEESSWAGDKYLKINDYEKREDKIM